MYTRISQVRNTIVIRKKICHERWVGNNYRTMEKRIPVERAGTRRKFIVRTDAFQVNLVKKKKKRRNGGKKGAASVERSVHGYRGETGSYGKVRAIRK